MTSSLRREKEDFRIPDLEQVQRMLVILWKRGSSYCFFQVTGRAKALFYRYTMLGNRNSVICYLLPIISSCHIPCHLYIFFLSLSVFCWLPFICYHLSYCLLYQTKFLFCNSPFWQGLKILPIFKGQRQYHRDNKREILGWPESLFGFFCNILQNLWTFRPAQ